MPSSLLFVYYFQINYHLSSCARENGNDIIEINLSAATLTTLVTLQINEEFNILRFCYVTHMKFFRYDAIDLLLINCYKINFIERENQIFVVSMSV